MCKYSLGVHYWIFRQAKCKRVALKISTVSVLSKPRQRIEVPVHQVYVAGIFATSVSYHLIHVVKPVHQSHTFEVVSVVDEHACYGISDVQVKHAVTVSTNFQCVCRSISVPFSSGVNYGQLGLCPVLSQGDNLIAKVGVRCGDDCRGCCLRSYNVVLFEWYSWWDLRNIRHRSRSLIDMFALRCTFLLTAAV